jgi:NAD(P)-dependent dehydrogenase (short-subunit alcohol dehydrogenase family)
MKNYLIVGGSSGIGLALSTQLAAENHQVWIASRSKPALNTPHISLDITQPIGGILDGLPDTLHGVAYCPGSINLKPFHRLTEGDFLSDFQINVVGAVRVLQVVLPRLKKANGASVVLFSTVASALGMNFHASIATAKGAVEGLAKSLAAEWALQQIRVNIVAPSLTDTPLASKILTNDEKREASGKRHPLGRIGTAAEVADIAAFLLSDKASWITGQIIGIDGGMSTLKP